MKTFNVVFARQYTIEAMDENEAEESAQDAFLEDVCIPLSDLDLFSVNADEIEDEVKNNG